MNYHVVEKNNPNALHAICYSRNGAEVWIEKYGDSKMFMDKTLTKDSFTIKEVK